MLKLDISRNCIHIAQRFLYQYMEFYRIMSCLLVKTHLFYVIQAIQLLLKTIKQQIDLKEKSYQLLHQYKIQIDQYIHQFHKLPWHQFSHKQQIIHLIFLHLFIQRFLFYLAFALLILVIFHSNVHIFLGTLDLIYEDLQHHCKNNHELFLRTFNLNQILYQHLQLLEDQRKY